MSEKDFNNIFVMHKGKKISIAQHFKDNKNAIQEVGVIHENGDIDIEPYANTLDSLIETLTQIKEQYK